MHINYEIRRDVSDGGSWSLTGVTLIPLGVSAAGKQHSPYRNGAETLA